MFDNATRKAERLNIYGDRMNVRLYNLVLGLIVTYGLVVNAIMVVTMEDFWTSMNPVAFLIFYFVCALAGIALAAKSGNPMVSFIGYNMVVIPIGGLLATCLVEYPIEDIFMAIVMVAVVAGLMMMLATMFPDIFRGMGRTLFICLCISIITELIALIFGYRGNLWNYGCVILFSLYLGYDWCKAQDYAKTLDNAVDSALDIYLDIINLFVRILSIISKSDD